MQTVTNEKPIEVKFDRLPYGYELVSEYQKICDVCGMSYFERSFLDPGMMIHTERMPCKCIMDEVYHRRIKKRLSEAKEKIRSRSMYYFGRYNMLNDKGYAHMTFENYKPENSNHKAALKALKNFKTGEDSVCLFGFQGRGKTHLAVSCARAQMQKGNIVLALKCVDVLKRIRQTYSSDKDAEAEIIDILQDIDLLMIDDIGTENPTDWVLEKLYMVIDYRVEHKKSCIFTTNLTGLEMSEKLGGAITSRIWGAGGRPGQFEIEGRDWRVT